MSQRTLAEQFEDARDAEKPFEALYEIAESLRDAGLSQLLLYRIFSELLQEQPEEGPLEFSDGICDVLDCICCGGWGGSRELFDTALTNEHLRVFSVDVAKPTADSKSWEMTIRHPQFLLRFQVAGTQAVREFLRFLRRHLQTREQAELTLGTLGPATVTFLREEGYPHQFSLRVAHAEGTMRYQLPVTDVGDFHGSLARAVEGMPSTE